MEYQDSRVELGQVNDPDEDEVTLGAIHDMAVRKINVVQLIDLFIGSSVDYHEESISFYFSDQAPVDKLEDLKNEFAAMSPGEQALSAVFEETGERGAGYVIRLSSKADDKLSMQVPVKGEVPVTGYTKGKVDVEDDGETYNGQDEVSEM